MKHINFKIEGDRKIYRIDRYDLVLVRNNENEEWKTDVYWETDTRAYKKHFCLKGAYRFCIPLCFETKHLKGTSEKYDKFIEL